MSKKIELKLTDDVTGLSVRATIEYDGQVRMKNEHNLSLVDDVLSHLVLELDSEINKKKK